MFDCESALRLHILAEEAAELSAGTQRTEAGLFEAAMQATTDRVQAGYIGVYLEGDLSVDKDDLMVAKMEGVALLAGKASIHAPNEDTLILVRIAALTSESEIITNHEFQSLWLPADAEQRSRLATEVRALESELEGAKVRMELICEEIDELVAVGLGLSPAEHALIKQRCNEFPLNVTVGRPRYVWSPDRKTQARRVYEPGDRFRT